jgi:hypothetical protein
LREYYYEGKGGGGRLILFPRDRYSADFDAAIISAERGGNAATLPKKSAFELILSCQDYQYEVKESLGRLILQYSQEIAIQLILKQQ